MIIRGLSLVKELCELSIQTLDSSWAGYPVLDDAMNVNTHAFLGWINVFHGDYIWSFDMENWMYCPETRVSQGGAWIYVPK